MSIQLYKHQFVVIDVETTGLNPEIHEITQLAAVLLQDTFEPVREFPVFNILIQPTNTGTIETKALAKSHLTLERLLIDGVDRETAVRLWHDWIYSITSQRGGKIIPIGFNYAFDREYIMAFMGRAAYEACIHPHFRDAQSMLLYISDRLGTFEYKSGIASFSLEKCCEALGVENLRAHDALHDCYATAACVYRLMRVALPT